MLDEVLATWQEYQDYLGCARAGDWHGHGLFPASQAPGHRNWKMTICCTVNLTIDFYNAITVMGCCLG